MSEQLHCTSRPPCRKARPRCRTWRAKRRGRVRRHAVDAVMHFGAYASVGDSVADPAKYYENNIGGGLVILRAMLDNGVRHLIFSSSAATYGEPQILPIPEDHPQKTTN